LLEHFCDLFVTEGKVQEITLEIISDRFWANIVLWLQATLAFCWWFDCISVTSGGLSDIGVIVAGSWFRFGDRPTTVFSSTSMMDEVRLV